MLMSWTEIGKNHLQAAKATFDAQPRSSASRAYYAAHVVLAEALVLCGCVLTPGRETPPRNRQPRLIGLHFADRGAAFVQELRAVIRRVQARRIDADYKRTVTFDRALALESIRDASTVFKLLDVE